MKPPERSSKGWSILTEIALLTVALSAAIIILAEVIAVHLTSRAMLDELRERSLRTAAEVAAILEEPLYILDNDQALRIGETLLSAGRISGIFLSSTATGEILSVASTEPHSAIPAIQGEIRRNGMALGSYRLEFSDRELRTLLDRIRSLTLAVVLCVIVAEMAAIRLVVIRRVDNAFIPVYGGLRAIAAGNYGARIATGRYADVNTLIGLVNGMTAQIQAKSDALRVANQTLEEKVALRTAELELSLRDLRLAQDMLVRSEKMSALGQLSAGMAHELNTPLGAILSSTRILVDFFGSRIEELVSAARGFGDEDEAFVLSLYRASAMNGGLPDLNVSSRRRRQEAKRRLEEAGIPGAGELAELLVELGLEDGLDERLESLRRPGAAGLLRTAVGMAVSRRMVQVIELAGGKAGTVVSALRSYLAPDAHEADRVVDLEEELDKVLTLMHNLLKHGVTVRRNYAGVLVRGSADRLGQVWLNLLRNAAQAMEFSGEIELRTGLRGDRAFVSVIDSGPGVPEPIRDRIFEPFFTTKRSGEGMGMGLDLCRQIVVAHGGSIALESEGGRTAFTVELPGGERKEIG